MSIGKTSINRVAAGLENEEAAAPLQAEIPAVAVEKKIVEGTAATAEKKPAAKKPAAKKPAAKKPAAKKPAAKKPAEKKPTEKKAEGKETKEAAVAPELVGQAVAAPAVRRGRKPGSKNKPKAQKKPAARIPRAVETVHSFYGVAIGEELPVHLL